MAKDQRNVLRLRRGRTVGLALIVIMGFLLFGFVFLVDEPTQIVIVPDDPFTPEDEEIVIEIPPIDLPFEIPIPLFEPKEIRITPIITTTDDLGVEEVIFGETTFLSQFTGFEITKVGSPDQTFDNGNLKIEISVGTECDIPQGSGQACPTPVIAIDSLLSTIFDDDPATKALVAFPASPAIGRVEAQTFVTKIFDARIDQLVTKDGESKFDFILDRFSVSFPPELQSASLIITPDFILANSTQIYSVTFNRGVQTTIDEQVVNGSDIVIVEEVTEDTPFVPCPLPVKDDSISILFPSIGVSGTSALWDKILIDGKLHDIINVDIRNNRNCDLTLAVGSQWQRVTGEIFRSDIETFIVPTNSTQPFSSIPFDGSVDCGTPAGNCAGLEIQWCFIAKATVDDVTEIVDPFCGKKFYR